jgi:hypothetical protein
MVHVGVLITHSTLLMTHITLRAQLAVMNMHEVHSSHRSNSVYSHYKSAHHAKQSRLTVVVVDLCAAAKAHISAHAAVVPCCALDQLQR